MNTLLKTSAVLFSLLIGISAVSAAPVLTEEDVRAPDFWTHMSEHGE